jgi:hypothetical protein
MFLIFLNLRSAIKKYCSDYKNEFKENILNFANWKKLRTIKDFFTLFTRATLATKGDFTFINFTLFIMDVLIKHL